MESLYSFCDQDSLYSITTWQKRQCYQEAMMQQHLAEPSAMNAPPPPSRTDVLRFLIFYVFPCLVVFGGYLVAYHTLFRGLFPRTTARMVANSDVEAPIMRVEKSKPIPSKTTRTVPTSGFEATLVRMEKIGAKRRKLGTGTVIKTDEVV